jgi:predicted cupin superfamily sugar epimerase
MPSGWIKGLQLEPHIEGGYYRQTFDATQQLATPSGKRSLMNTIYYLLTEDSPIGHFHRNSSDITHFYHAGGPVNYVLISPQGELSKNVLGPDLGAGQVIAFTTPGQWWKSSHLPAGVSQCLISEVTAPGFDYADHELATVALFKTKFPDLVEGVRGFILS